MGAITEQIGRELAGRYRLEAGLGTGASAHVYAAIDLRLSRRVAVKVLHPGLSGDRAFLRRFSAEAQSVAALSHPNIVQVFDWGEEEDGPFLVLEYLGGGSLRDLLDAGGRLSPAQAAAVGAGAARGLAYAHRRGLVHRDIKPENLLFDEDGGVHIADFGLARALAEAAWTEPAGAVLGTARYASPEQAEGKALEGRSDVYALALVLYEAMTGSVPFSADTTVATLMARVGAALPPATELGALAPVLAQAAISEPLVRLQADELAADLELLSRSLAAPTPLPLAPQLHLPPPPAEPPAPLRGRARTAPPPPAPPAEVPERAAPAAASAPPGADAFDVEPWVVGGAAPSASAGAAAAAEVETEEPAPRRHRGRWLALVAVLVVLAGGAVVGVRYLHRRVGVPAVAGSTLSAATHQLRSSGLRLGAVTSAYSASVPSGAVVSELPLAGHPVKPGTAVALVVSRGRAPVAVPSLAKMTRAAAEQRLAAAHLVAASGSSYSETVPAGEVISEAPASGTVAYGSTVHVVVSAGPAPRTIPTFSAGTTWAAASAALTNLRLVPVEQQEYSDTAPAGAVIATSPAEGAGGVPVGTKVSVVVSLGPRLVTVPTVAGDTINQAIAALQAAGLQVTEQIGPPFATKASTTDPAPGARVRPGSSITLYAS